jgi:hypothetical protein
VGCPRFQFFKKHRAIGRVAKLLERAVSVCGNGQIGLGLRAGILASVGLVASHTTANCSRLREYFNKNGGLAALELIVFSVQWGGSGTGAGGGQPGDNGEPVLQLKTAAALAHALGLWDRE